VTEKRLSLRRQDLKTILRIVLLDKFNVITNKISWAKTQITSN
jgi:hypothetical protein